MAAAAIGIDRKQWITAGLVVCLRVVLMVMMTEMLRWSTVFMLAIGRRHSPGGLKRNNQQHEGNHKASHGADCSDDPAVAQTIDDQSA